MAAERFSSKATAPTLQQDTATCSFRAGTSINCTMRTNVRVETRSCASWSSCSMPTGGRYRATRELLSDADLGAVTLCAMHRAVGVAFTRNEALVRLRNRTVDVEVRECIHAIAVTRRGTGS